MTLSAGSHNGDMELHAFASAVRGCNRSGERARRNNGEPGSDVLHGRPNDEPTVLTTLPPLGINEQTADGPATDDTPPEPKVVAAFGVDSSEEGLYDCVVFELPGW